MVLYPVAQVNIIQSEGSGIVNLLQYTKSAEAAALHFRVKKTVYRWDSVTDNIRNGDGNQFAVLAKLQELGIAPVTIQKLFEILFGRVCHRAIEMARIKVTAVEIEMLITEAGSDRA